MVPQLSRPPVPTLDAIPASGPLSILSYTGIVASPEQLCKWYATIPGDNAEVPQRHRKTSTGSVGPAGMS